MIHGIFAAVKTQDAGWGGGGEGGALTSPAGSASEPRLQTGVAELLMLGRCCCWLLWLPGHAGSSCPHLLWPIQLGCATNSHSLLSPPVQ